MWLRTRRPWAAAGSSGYSPGSGCSGSPRMPCIAGCAAKVQEACQRSSTLSWLEKDPTVRSATSIAPHAAGTAKRVAAASTGARRCVLSVAESGIRFDHHCNWIDHCVGRANHGLFFLWLSLKSILIGQLLVANLLVHSWAAASVLGCLAAYLNQYHRNQRVAIAQGLTLSEAVNKGRLGFEYVENVQAQAAAKSRFARAWTFLWPNVDDDDCELESETMLMCPP